MTKKNTRIVGLKIRNVKRLSAVDYQPDPKQNVIGVGGKNAAGKTSMLDSIMYALGGTKNIPDGAVREGAKKAEIEIELDEFIVKRIIGKGAKLEITSKDKKKFASPQTLLDDMVGKLTFDPLRFQRLCETPAGRREQAELLRQLVGLDFTELDQKRAGVYSERSDVNRELKRVTSNLEASPHYSDAPKETVSIQDLSKQLAEAVKHNQAVASYRLEVKRNEEAIAETESQIQALEESLEAAKRLLGKHRAAMLVAEAKVEDFKEADESGLRDKIAKSDGINQKVRSNVARNALLKEQDKQQSQYDELTAQLERIDGKKKGQLAEAEMPVDGLTFTEDAVLYRGKPFENCSSAEQLRVSVAMGIASNPKLRIMLIRDGSLLDKSSRQMLREMAQKADVQIWVEFVDRNEECSVIISDGMILETL